MQPSTFRLNIAASLFTLIATVSLTWWVSQIPDNPQIPAARSNIELPSLKDSFDPTIYSVTFCELVKSPAFYDRKLVQMHAVFVNGIDWSYLASNECPDKDGTVQATAAIESNDKLIERESPQELGPLLVTIDRGERPLEVNVKVMGRFYAGDRNGRGHQFAIVSTSNARPTGNRIRR